MVEVSICIPVYGTECYLRKCLESVAAQTFTNYEVVVVNDCSSGKDEKGHNCRKIVKECKKQLKLPINYVEHSQNLGVLEARRRAVEEAKGQYIINLDSDDTLTPDAVEVLYNQAKITGADIVQGSGETFYIENVDSQDYSEPEDSPDKKKQREEKIQKRAACVYDGILENEDILRNFLVEKKQSGFVWAKLIKKELYLKAFARIPSMYCIMADDFIQYFWICYYAKKYSGITNVVYNYSINTGISSHKTIKDLHTWSQVCSTASVFTALFSEIEYSGISFTEEEMKCLYENNYYYVGNNLKQWKVVVDSEIKDDAYNLLCEYWGKPLVQQVEQEMKKQGAL